MATYQLPHGRCRRLQGLLSRGGHPGRAQAAAAAWLPELEPHVPRPDPAAGRPLPHHRARPARASASPTCRRGTSSLHVRQPRRRHRPLHRGRRLRPLRALRLRLRRADRLPPRHPASGADHRDHLPERQRLRGRPERRLESDPCLLAGAVAGQPRGAARLPDARDDASGSTPTACPTRRPSRRTAIRSTTSTWRGPAPTRSSSTCSATTRATSRSIRPSRTISARTSRRFWRSGARTTRSSCRPAPRRSSATSRDADVRFFDTGHFALETHAEPIAEAIRDFLT